MSSAEHHYKIYRYVEPHLLPPCLSMSPSHLIFPDQLSKNLPKKTNILYGERRQSIYCDRFVDGEYLDPVVKIDYSFKRDSRGFVYEKLRTISWQTEGDKWSEVVQTDVIPVVAESEKLREIKRRRSNIIDELKGLAKKYTTPDIPLESKILEIFEENQLLINSYIDAGSSRFRDAIAASKQSWLDVVHPVTKNKSRDVLLQYLSIGLTV